MAEKDTARSQFLMMCHEVLDNEKTALVLEMFDRQRNTRALCDLYCQARDAAGGYHAA